MKRYSLYFILICLFSCKTKQENIGLPYYHSPDFTPIWLTNKNHIDTLHALTNFEFRNQGNIKITPETFKGKIHVMNTFFSVCPSLCPKIMGNMHQIQNAFKDDKNILIASYSVTPERDSASVLRKYADINQIMDNKWHLITGNKKQIYKIARKSYFADENIGVQKDENDFLHSENFILVDKNLHIRGVYNGTLQLEIEQLIADIKMLENE